MKTIDIEPTSLQMSEGLAAVIRSLESIEDFNDVISQIKARSLTIEKIDKYPWKEVPTNSLRMTVVKQRLYNINSPQMAFFLERLINLNTFHFEDFQEMANDWENVDFKVTTAIILKTQEVGVYLTSKIKEPHIICEIIRKSQAIANKIANSGSRSWIAIKTMNESM